jgi:tRNA-splicing ligase RtcB
MRLSLFYLRPAVLEDKFNLFKEALEGGTNFGVGQSYKPYKSHPVMDEDWGIAKVTRDNKDKAWGQLGTSGSGNHFCEFGSMVFLDGVEIEGVRFEPGQQCVALMSHSGSRGTGAQVCNTYSGIASQRMPSKFADLGQLAWLDMDTEAGQEYWLAMNLMGRYAAACHEIIHRSVAKLIGETPVAYVENHHNFAWKETHFGKEVYVHRKGATPAGKGVLGVIPGSMGTPAYLVRGLGNPDSLCSASHGAGRKMSRKKAKETYSWKAVKHDLEKKGIHVLSSGADEVPGAYKDIDEVMAQQADLVQPIARFSPKIVKMSDDGKSED